MRPIKFKAKRIDTGEWVESKGVFFFDDGTCIMIHSEKNEQLHTLPIDPSTLCQFVEVSKIKLWEHDLCNVGENLKCKVVYVDEAEYNYDKFYACFALQSIDNPEMIFPIDEYAIEHITVTGNIHDKTRL